MITQMHGMAPDGSWKPIVISAEGSIAQPINNSSWFYAGAAGGVTGTADVALKAASTTGAVNYLQSMQVINKGATATEIVVKDGSTVVWRSYVGASMLTGVSFRFDPPLQTTPNTAMNFACITTGTATIVSAQGFTSSSASQIDDTISVSVFEIFTDAGLPLLDDNGNQLTLN